MQKKREINVKMSIDKCRTSKSTVTPVRLYWGNHHPCSQSISKCFFQVTITNDSLRKSSYQFWTKIIAIKMTEMTIANAVLAQHRHRARQSPNSKLNANFQVSFNAKCTFSIVNCMVTPHILLALRAFHLVLY